MIPSPRLVLLKQEQLMIAPRRADANNKTGAEAGPAVDFTRQHDLSANRLPLFGILL
jgi:hypothetical protein